MKREDLIEAIDNLLTYADGKQLDLIFRFARGLICRGGWQLNKDTERPARALRVGLSLCQFIGKPFQRRPISRIQCRQSGNQPLSKAVRLIRKNASCKLCDCLVAIQLFKHLAATTAQPIFVYFKLSANRKNNLVRCVASSFFNIRNSGSCNANPCAKCFERKAKLVPQL